MTDFYLVIQLMNVKKYTLVKPFLLFMIIYQKFQVNHAKKNFIVKMIWQGIEINSDRILIFSPYCYKENNKCNHLLLLFYRLYRQSEWRLPTSTQQRASAAIGQTKGKECNCFVAKSFHNALLLRAGIIDALVWTSGQVSWVPFCLRNPNTP